MPTPYRDPSPPPPDEIETEEPYAKVLRAQQRRARVLTLALAGAAGAVLLAAAGRPAPAKTPENDALKREEARRTRARDAIASARFRAGAEQERFAVAVRGALASEYRARPELGACPITLAQPTGIGRPFPLVVVERADVDALRIPSRAIADVLVDITRAEEYMASGRYEEAMLYADALDRPGRLVVDVVLVPDVDAPPKVTNGSTFVPGKLAGNAYLYEFASHRVVCMTRAEASSEASVGYAYALEGPTWRGAVPSLEATLTRELLTSIERSIATSMTVRAAP